MTEVKEPSDAAIDRDLLVVTTIKKTLYYLAMQSAPGSEPAYVGALVQFLVKEITTEIPEFRALLIKQLTNEAKS